MAKYLCLCSMDDFVHTDDNHDALRLVDEVPEEENLKRLLNMKPGDSLDFRNGSIIRLSGVETKAY